MNSVQAWNFNPAAKISQNKPPQLRLWNQKNEIMKKTKIKIDMWQNNQRFEITPKLEEQQQIEYSLLTPHLFWKFVNPLADLFIFFLNFSLGQYFCHWILFLVYAFFWVLFLASTLARVLFVDNTFVCVLGQFLVIGLCLFL